MRYNIHFSCVSHIGKVRSVNQDNFICDGRYMDPDGEPVEFPLCGIKPSNKASVFGIFDGMGGEECGEIAALIASKDAAELKIGKEPVKDLMQFCEKSNADICDYTEHHDISAMGTTAAILAFHKKGAVLCNVGDSKIFRYSGGALAQISQDHVAFAAFGTKPPLSQNLGIPPEELEIEPYFAEGRYHDGDVYLICSDGLTDMVSTEQIAEVLSQYPPEEAVTLLRDQALEHGGKDNVTILICKIQRKTRKLFIRVRRTEKKEV